MPKSRAEAGSMGKEMGPCGEYSFVNMAKSSLRNRWEVNQAMIGEFKIQEDVEMRSQLPGYGDFRGSYLRSESDTAEIPRRIY